MLYGMGTVVLFLALLVLATTAMSADRQPLFSAAGAAAGDGAGAEPGRGGHH